MNQTVNISFEELLLIEIDKLAKKEHRSRSELIREAARTYIEKKTKWQAIFDFAEKSTKRSKISEQDIFKEIKSVRKNKKIL